jgi:hypothetical protein
MMKGMPVIMLMIQHKWWCYSLLLCFDPNLTTQSSYFNDANRERHQQGTHNFFASDHAWRSGRKQLCHVAVSSKKGFHAPYTIKYDGSGCVH